PTQCDGEVGAPDDAGEELGVRPPAEGRVEVDEVQPLGALLLPREGCLEGGAELAAGAGDPRDELPGAALHDVDGRQELQPGWLGRAIPHAWILPGRVVRQLGA